MVLSPVWVSLTCRCWPRADRLWSPGSLRRWPQRKASARSSLLTTEEAERPRWSLLLAAKIRTGPQSLTEAGAAARTAWTDEWDRPDCLRPASGMPLQSALVSDPQLRINQAAGQPAKAQSYTYFVGQVVGSLDRAAVGPLVVLGHIEEFLIVTPSGNCRLVCEGELR